MQRRGGVLQVNMYTADSLWVFVDVSIGIGLCTYVPAAVCHRNVFCFVPIIPGSTSTASSSTRHNHRVQQHSYKTYSSTDCCVSCTAD